VGTIGDAGSFSFYPGKNLGAYGDAGCMVTANEELAIKARIIANHGRLGKFDHMIEGRNSRLDGLQAAILSTKLPHLPRWTELRRSHASSYDRLLGEVGIQLPEVPPYASHVFHLYVIQVPYRERIREELAVNGVETGIHYPIPLPFLKAYSGMGYKKENFPVASEGTGCILSLPMFAELSENQLEYVATTLIHSII
jgi:dTDP-4-amino-4,6-dideoxygalactose transaminase